MVTKDVELDIEFFQRKLRELREHSEMNNMGSADVEMVGLAARQLFECAEDLQDRLGAHRFNLTGMR